MKSNTRIVITLLLLAGAASTRADQAAYQAAVTAAATPSLWYRNARTPNYGNGGASYTLTGGAAMTNLTADLWNIADAAFGLPNSAAGGAAVAGSTGLFASGTQGSVSFLFKTPAVVTETDSLFNQGSYGATSQLELLITASKLRLGTQNGASQPLTFISDVLLPETWYFTAITWDLNKASNDLTWYFGQTGGTLTNGTLTITSAGAANAPLYVGGRSSGNTFGGFFRHVAVYPSELTASAVQAQFDAITKPPVSLKLVILQN